MATSSPYPTYDTGALLTLTNAGNVTVSSPDQSNDFGRGVTVVANLTFTAGNLTIHVQGKDNASGQYYDLLTSAVLSGNATTSYTVYPGVTVSSNVAASAPLPAIWRVEAVIGSTGNVSGTVGASVTA
jgi:hypothetical protein